MHDAANRRKGDCSGCEPGHEPHGAAQGLRHRPRGEPRQAGAHHAPYQGAGAPFDHSQVARHVDEHGHPCDHLRAGIRDRRGSRASSRNEQEIQSDVRERGKGVHGEARPQPAEPRHEGPGVVDKRNERERRHKDEEHVSSTGVVPAVDDSQRGRAESERPAVSGSDSTTSNRKPRAYAARMRASAPAPKRVATAGAITEASARGTAVSAVTLANATE